MLDLTGLRGLGRTLICSMQFEPQAGSEGRYPAGATSAAGGVGLLWRRRAEALPCRQSRLPSACDPSTAQRVTVRRRLTP